MSSSLTARGVAFELPNGRKLFNNLNFSLDAKVTALVGPNGVGKTSLARLLAGELHPSQGTILRNAPITLFAQRAECPNTRVADVLAGVYTWSKLGEALLANIDRDALCTTLSGGEWMRVRLARTLDESFLILDEPTNDLDKDGRAVLLRFLRERTGGVLLISHDRACLHLCDDVLELSSHGLSKFGGGYAAYTRARDLERDRLRTQLEAAKRKRDDSVASRHEQRARQDKRNRRGAAAASRGGAPAILFGARKSRAEQVTGRLDAAGAARNEAAVQAAHAAFSALKSDPVMYADLVGGGIASQKLVAEANTFNIRFDDWLYARDLQFAWRGPVRIALKGGNGSGKSTLLKAILGGQFSSRGELRRGALTRLYLDQRCCENCRTQNRSSGKTLTDC